MLFHLLNRIRAQFNSPGCHLIAGFGEKDSIGSADIEHLDALRFDSHLSQEFLSLINSLFGSQISFQEMTIAFLSAGGENGICAVFKGFQQMQGIQLAGAH
jgi:hypothetical protein